MSNNQKTALLPPVRVPATMRQDLEAIAANSITDNLGAHIRAAVDQYIQSNQQSPAPAPAQQPEPAA